MTSPLSVTWSTFHGSPGQSQNAGLGRELADGNQGRNIGAAFMAESEA